MAAINTPLPDLIELSSINANATFTTTPGGGGDIIGLVDNATYFDTDPSNSPTELRELNETSSGNGGTLKIDGVEYNIQLAVPDSGADDVTVTYDNGLSSTDLSGSGSSSQIVFITASPTGGGSDRYFVAFDDGVGNLPNITSIQIRDLDFTPAGDDVNINLEQNQTVTPACFTPGTRILTPEGLVPVESLCVGDHVVTLDNGAQPVRWLGHQEMDFKTSAARHRPVQIKAYALGAVGPQQNLMISPQHGILLHGRMVQRLFRQDRVLARAKGLTGLRNVRIAAGKRKTTYITCMLDRHEIICANGTLTESFYPGPTALASLTTDHRRQLSRVFPNLRTDPETEYGAPVCRVLTKAETIELSMAM